MLFVHASVCLCLSDYSAFGICLCCLRCHLSVCLCVCLSVSVSVCLSVLIMHDVYNRIFGPLLSSAGSANPAGVQQALPGLMLCVCESELDKE